MGKRDKDLEKMGLNAEEIAYVNQMSKAGALNAGVGGLRMQAENNEIHRNNIIKDVLSKRGTKASVGPSASASASASAGGAVAGSNGVQSTNESSSSQSSFSGLENGVERDLIKNLLKQFGEGGTEAYKEAQKQKGETISKIDAQLRDYSKRSAFADAGDLMASQMAKAMEAQKPAIQRAIEGAGTSASSMQALLSQKLAADVSRESGALGAQQAVAYGQISGNLMGNRAGLTTGVDQSIDPILRLTDMLKITSSQSQQNSKSVGYFDPSNSMNAETNRLRADQEQQRFNVQQDFAQKQADQQAKLAQAALQDSQRLQAQQAATSAQAPMQQAQQMPVSMPQQASVDPYAGYTSVSNAQLPTYRQYDVTNSEVPIPTNVSGNTTTYGTDPYSSGYMSITKNPKSVNPYA